MDQHHVAMGRWCSLLGVFVSVGTPYLVMSFSNIIDYAQVIFIFFIVPLFGTVILGMLWKRATPAGGFWGLFAGIMTSFGLWLWVHFQPAALVYVAFSMRAKDMSENVFRAAWSLLACVVVTVVVSLVTRPRAEAELEGLVYGLTKIPSQEHFPVFQRPVFWAGAVAVLFVIVNVGLW